MPQIRRRVSLKLLALLLLGVVPAATRLEIRGGWLLKPGDR